MSKTYVEYKYSKFDSIKLLNKNEKLNYEILVVFLFKYLFQFIYRTFFI